MLEHLGCMVAVVTASGNTILVYVVLCGRLHLYKCMHCTSIQIQIRKEPFIQEN